MALTIHEEYFLLTGGIERWLYRVARKHALSQEMSWTFAMTRTFPPNPKRRIEVDLPMASIPATPGGTQKFTAENAEERRVGTEGPGTEPPSWDR